MMKPTIRAATLIGTALLTVIVLVAVFDTGKAQLTHAASTRTITNGPQHYDTSGNQIEAYGSAIFWANGTYYMTGLDFTGDTSGTDYFHGMNCYASTDLVNWAYVGQILAPQSSGDLSSSRIVEGGRIIYNSATNRYVMWLHIDSPQYSEGKVGTATSSSVCGTYTYNGSTNPLGNAIFDNTAFVDTDGSAYLLASTRQTDGSFAIGIYALSADYLQVQSLVTTVGSGLEAPNLVKNNGVYFFLGSQRTGWATNPNVYQTATNIAGPWSAPTDVAPPGTNTWNTQDINVLGLDQGNGNWQYVYIGSRWNPNNLNDSRSIWLPMTLDSASRTMAIPAYYANWQLNAPSWTWSGAPNKFQSVVNNTTLNLQLTSDPYTPCNNCGALNVAATPDAWNVSQQSWQLVNVGGTQFKLQAQINNTTFDLQVTGDNYMPCNCGAYDVAATPDAGNSSQQVWTLVTLGTNQFKLQAQINNTTFDLQVTGDNYMPCNCGAYNVAATPDSFNLSQQAWTLATQVS